MLATYLGKKESSKSICYSCMYANQVKLHVCFIALYYFHSKYLEKKLEISVFWNVKILLP